MVSNNMFNKTSALFILILVLLVAATTTNAEIATETEMENVCRNWLSFVAAERGDWNGSSYPDILSGSPLVHNGVVLAQYYEVEPSGYVVVPILKELPAVKAYSTESRLNTEDTSGFVQLLRDVLSDRLRLYEEIYGSLEASQPGQGDVLLARDNHEQWDRYSVNPETFEANLQGSARAPLDVVGPLLTTAWDQGAPYNDYCPMGDGARCVAGCVATAYAQIMAFHQWPLAGDGSHTYWWYGDGPVPGRYLSADFSDPYDWDHIINSCYFGCEPEDSAALAELNYEVGVACEMGYGADGSGAWPSIMLSNMPMYFGYSWDIDEVYRSSYSASAWFDIVKQQIDQNMPIHYVIYSHAIVCDGYSTSGGSMQYHMNYGWAEGHNAWYAVDNLYCPWEGCDPMIEHMIINIFPDRAVLIEADATIGWAPFAVQFTGSSDLEVDTWTWAFSDGGAAFVQSPLHVFDSAGVYDVSLWVDAGGDIRTRTKTDFITVLADSMMVGDVEAAPSASVEVTVHARNTVAVNKIWVPVMYDQGDLELTYDSFSTEGCRTDYFEIQSLIQYSPVGRKATIGLQSSTNGSVADLAPGTGPIVKLYFALSPSAQPGQSTVISLDQNPTYVPMFFTDKLDYESRTVAGSVGCAGGGGVSISLDRVVGMAGPTTISAGRLVTAYLRLTNLESSDFRGVTNGFRIHSPDGAQWSATVPDTLSTLDWDASFMFFYPNETNVDGLAADTVGFGGVGTGISPEVGIPAGFDDTVFTISIGPIDSIYMGRTICLDSCWYPPSGAWKWDGGSGVGYRYPAWDGPHCFDIGYGSCCLPPIRGNVDYSPDDIIDIADLVYLVDFMFTEGPAPECMEEADIDGSGLGAPIDISDLVYLVDYMFASGPEPQPCP